MDQRLSFITFGVRDLDAMKKFYTEKFGWTLLKEMGDIAFIKLNGCILGLYPARELADDIGIPENGKGFKQFTLAINFRTEQEVDQAFKQLRDKDVHIVKNPVKVSWGGYSGYVADIEDNYWEIACNPFLELDKAGNVVTHQ